MDRAAHAGRDLWAKTGANGEHEMCWHDRTTAPFDNTRKPGIAWATAHSCNTKTTRPARGN
eukprot:11218345-Lingulodinium_polyedra.AAC.1